MKYWNIEHVRPVYKAVTIAGGSKIVQGYKQNSIVRVTLPPGTTYYAW